MLPERSRLCATLPGRKPSTMKVDFDLNDDLPHWYQPINMQGSLSFSSQGRVRWSQSVEWGLAGHDLMMVGLRFQKPVHMEYGRDVALRQVATTIAPRLEVELLHLPRDWTASM